MTCRVAFRRIRPRFPSYSNLLGPTCVSSAATRANAPQLTPSIERIIRKTRRRPRTVTGDHGYRDTAVDNILHDLGVRTVVIPARGQTQHGPPSP